MFLCYKTAGEPTVPSDTPLLSSKKQGNKNCMEIGVYAKGGCVRGNRRFPGSGII